MVSSDLRGVWGFDYTSMFAFKFPRVLLKKVQKATFILFCVGPMRFYLSFFLLLSTENNHAVIMPRKVSSLGNLCA